MWLRHDPEHHCPFTSNFQHGLERLEHEIEYFFLRRSIAAGAKTQPKKQPNKSSVAEKERSGVAEKEKSVRKTSSAVGKEKAKAGAAGSGTPRSSPRASPLPAGSRSPGAHGTAAKSS